MLGAPWQQAIRLLGEPWLLELFPSGGQWLAVALRYRGKQQSTHRIMSLWFANDAQVRSCAPIPAKCCSTQPHFHPPAPLPPANPPPPPRGLRLSALQEPVLSILSHRPYGFTPYNEWTQQSCEPEPSRVAPARPARRDRSAERC